MSFTISKATRVGIKPLIVPYSESGCGKTMSSLLLARGLAGPVGKIVMADSESRRGSLYADVIPGGFDTFDLCAPFSPARYIAAVDAIEESGAAVGIIDSGSHEWDSIGSVLDMAGDNEQKSGRAGLHNWKTPKLEHAKFVQRLLRTRIPFIICLRAKHKSRQTKDERGKTQIVKDDFASPIQADDFIFEATCHFEILHDHSIRLTKCSHPSLRECFPDTGPITIAHGQALAKWCVAPGCKPTLDNPDGIPGDVKSLLRAKLWKLCDPIRGKEQTWTDAEAKLWEWKILPETVRVSKLLPEELSEVIEKLEIQLGINEGKL